jgi:hypothetical protein
VLGVSALGLASAVEPRLSVFALLGLVIGLAATTRLPEGRRTLPRGLLLAALVPAALGLARFARGEALPGIAEARGRDVSNRSVSLLREVLFAEDAMRRYAELDHDGDGVGSAALLGELAGATPARGAKRLATPPLAPRHAPRAATSSGPALAADGYLLILCLPTPSGGLTARPGDAIDEEAAERRWVGYAWPADDRGPRSAYFIDEHERILESAGAPADAPRLVGGEHAPACDDALARPELWRPWRDKRPRDALPGDRR